MRSATRCWRRARISGSGFDGDGDRCGVVDNLGNEIFADKVGVMLARDISSLHRGAKFVVDVKSTGLFQTDAVLKANGAATDYWKTGHSHIKRRVAQLGAIADFRNPAVFSSIRRSGAAMMMALSPQSPCARCSTAIPGSRWPNSNGAARYLRHADHVAALRRRGEVRGGGAGACGFRGDAGGRGGLRGSEDRRSRHGERCQRGRRGRDLGACTRVVKQAGDGGGGGKPLSPERRREMFEAVDAVLRRNPEVGAYNQTF